MIGFKVHISLIYYSFWSRRWNSSVQLQIRKPRCSSRETLCNQMQLFLHPNRCPPLLHLTKKGERRSRDNLECSLHPFAPTDQLRGGKTLRVFLGRRKDKEAGRVGCAARTERNQHSQRFPLVPGISTTPSPVISTTTFEAGIMLRKVK